MLNRFTSLARLVAVSALITTGAHAADLTGNVRIDGSSTVFPVTEAVAEEFRNEAPKVKVTIGISGTGGGFKKFTAGETDISNASRPIKAEEIAKAKENKIDFIELPVAYDGLSIVVNPKNTWANSITIAQLKKLWEPGSTVKTWKDLDPTWPANPIKLYGPGTDSGTFDYFTEEVVGKARASRPDYTASEDDNVLVGGIAGDVNALGYFGFAYYSENKTKIKALQVDGGKGPITADDKTIENSTYPLSRPVFIVVSTKAAARPEVDAFIKFYLKNISTIAKDVGYTPLPKAMYDEALKRYETRKTGTWHASL
jgi:phosphate transport system substrate-binding protein